MDDKVIIIMAKLFYEAYRCGISDIGLEDLKAKIQKEVDAHNTIKETLQKFDTLLQN